MRKSKEDKVESENGIDFFNKNSVIKREKLRRATQPPYISQVFLHLSLLCPKNKLILLSPNLPP
jgi:hypothetical protein